MVYQQKWYVVIVGKKPGVYASWIEAGPQTKNIPGGSIHQSFLSEDEAVRMFEAAEARGEVRAYPDADKSTGKSKNMPLSPLGAEVSLLSVPLDVKGGTESISRQQGTSVGHSPAAKLRRTLGKSVERDSCSTSSSPPTGVTQVYAPLYEEDDSPPNSPVARPSPHFTFTSSSSRAYPSPVVSEGRLFAAGKATSLQLEVSDWSSPPPTPLFSDSHPGAEEHTSKSPGCVHLHPKPPTRSIGVEYRSLADLADMESVDSRVWLPQSRRTFDPDKIKPKPATRPPSPAKRYISLASSHDTVCSSPQLQRQTSLIVDSPFIRVDRGKHSRLTPSLSLPVLPDRELECNRSGFGSHSTHFQVLGDHCTDEERRPALLVLGQDLAERPASHGPSPRKDGRSHVQLLPRDGTDKQSAIVVHCPPNCHHKACYPSPRVLPVSKPASPRYADACVSPIIAIIGSPQGIDSPAKRSNLNEDLPYELAGLAFVSHKGITAPESDVRSPIPKGTMVPMNVAEVGRMRWQRASRARRLARLTGLLAFSDLACFSVVLVLTVLTHVIWALQNTVWATVSSSAGL